MRLKGVSPLIGFILVIVVSITAVTIVLVFGQNIISQSQDAAVVSEATNNIDTINSLIQQVATEGPGSVLSTQLRSSGGTYRVSNSSGQLSFTYTLKSNILPVGTFKQTGPLTTGIVTTAASATQNSTNLILQNEILTVVLQRIGNSSSLDGINTSTLLQSITIKSSGTTVTPNDSSIIIGNVSNSSWGIGYTQLVAQGTFLTEAQALAHVRSNATGNEYSVLFTLPSSADFLLIDVQNVTNNQTTMQFAYHLGSNATDDVIRINGQETTYTGASPSPACYTKPNETYVCSYDQNDFSPSVVTALIPTTSSYYFNSLCEDQFNSNNYKFNVTVTGNLNLILPFTQGTCSATVGNKTSIVQSQGIPNGAFTSYSTQGQKTFQLQLAYDKIELNGNLLLGSGTYQVCVQKTGVDNGRAVVTVTEC